MESFPGMVFVRLNVFREAIRDQKFLNRKVPAMGQVEQGNVIWLHREPHWNEKSFLIADVINQRDWMANVIIRFHGENGRVFQIRAGIFPHWPTRLSFPLVLCRGEILFPDRTPGRFKAVVSGPPLRWDELQA
ncbi:MAG: hypothetical protein D6820_05390, partial [Lentisphaerae bacterium]